MSQSFVYPPMTCQSPRHRCSAIRMMEKGREKVERPSKAENERTWQELEELSVKDLMDFHDELGIHRRAWPRVLSGGNPLSAPVGTHSCDGPANQGHYPGHRHHDHSNSLQHLRQPTCPIDNPVFARAANDHDASSHRHSPERRAIQHRDAAPGRGCMPPHRRHLRNNYVHEPNAVRACFGSPWRPQP